MPRQVKIDVIPPTVVTSNFPLYFTPGLRHCDRACSSADISSHIYDFTLHRSTQLIAATCTTPVS